MKKYIIGIVLVFLSYLIFVFFNPPKSTYTSVSINCTNTALERNIFNIKNWEKWWPGKKINDTTFIFNDVKYSISKLLLSGVLVDINAGGKTISGYLQIESINDTSCNLVWNPTSEIALTISEKLLKPFTKCILRDNIILLLDSLKNYFSDQKNLYGFKVNVSKVSNPYLISIKKNYLQYPSSSEIYETVEKLKAYIISSGAMITNSPMMNVHRSEVGNTFDVMIALPTNIPLNPSGDFLPKFMMKGSLLEAEVKGGATLVEKCLAQFSNYLIDYKLSAPAIPYQTLVTDRSQVLDSNLWITKIYQPVIVR